ncbi:hypothetical protein DC094_02060 [Pelagibaculum spongiae]|uniref:Uncharacterized protein n=1 Tax=Pelagibaculum spongiae TaxID=2080658 RepID=A0A2V1H043_9GAMM|nr:hypothetical protein DC094_02060 [Pelagibaculum spongiae]
MAEEARIELAIAEAANNGFEDRGDHQISSASEYAFYNSLKNDLNIALNQPCKFLCFLFLISKTQKVLPLSALVIRFFI